MSHPSIFKSESHHTLYSRHVSLKQMCRLTQSYTLDKKCSIKINQREIIKKQNKVELRFLCTALQDIARNTHTKFGIIWTYSDSYSLDKEIQM